MLRKENDNNKKQNQTHLKMEYDYLRFLYSILSNPEKISIAVQENAYIDDQYGIRSHQKLAEKKQFLFNVDPIVFTQEGKERGSNRFTINKRSSIESLAENAGLDLEELKKSSLRDRVIFASTIAAAEALLSEKIFDESPDSLQDPEILNAISASPRRINEQLHGFHLKEVEEGFSYEMSDELKQSCLERMKWYEEMLGIKREEIKNQEKSNNSFVAYLKDKRITPQLDLQIDKILKMERLKEKENVKQLARFFDDLRHPKDKQGVLIKIPKDEPIPAYTDFTGKFDLLYATFPSIIQDTTFPVTENNDLSAWLELKLITALDDVFTEEGKIQPELAKLINTKGGLDFALNASHIGEDKLKSMLFASYMISVVFKEIPIIQAMDDKDGEFMYEFTTFYKKWIFNVKNFDPASIAQIYQNLNNKLHQVQSNDLRKLIKAKLTEREVKLKIQNAQARRDSLSEQEKQDLINVQSVKSMTFLKDELNRLRTETSKIKKAIDDDKQMKQTLEVKCTKYANSIDSKTKEILALDASNKPLEEVGSQTITQLKDTLKSKQAHLENLIKEEQPANAANNDKSSLSGWKLAGAIGLGIIALGGVAFLLTVVWPVVPVLAIGSAIFGAASVSASSSTIFAVTATAITAVAGLLGGALGFLVEKKTNLMNKLRNFFSKKDKDQGKPLVKEAISTADTREVYLAKLEVSLVSHKLKKLEADKTITTLEKNIAKNTEALPEKEQQIAGIKETLRGLSNVSNSNSMFKKSSEEPTPRTENEEIPQEEPTPNKLDQ